MFHLTVAPLFIPALAEASGIGLIDRTQAYRNRTAIVDAHGHTSYGTLFESSGHAAAQLLADRTDLNETSVAFLVPGDFRYVVTQWGIWRAGGKAVPLCLKHPLPELEYVIRNSGAQTVVIDPSLPQAAAFRSWALEQGLRILTLNELLQARDATLPIIDPDREAMVLYTSGTSGTSGKQPKGVVTTHRTFQAQIEPLIDAWQWTQNDRILNVLPLHHLHGILNVVACALWIGATVEMQTGFDSVAVWARLISGDLSLFMAVPEIYTRLIAHWEAQEEGTRAAWTGASLRLMVCGSAPLPLTTLARWQKVGGHHLLNRAGMTETGMNFSQALEEALRVDGTVGKPLPGVLVRIVACDEHGHFDGNGIEVPVGQPGHLLLKGPHLFKGYLGDPVVTASAFTPDGWFITGDGATQLPDGNYTLNGRFNHDIFNTGGEQVSALEIERVLADHPAIGQIYVVGVPDPLWGRAVAAVVVLKTGHSLSLAELRRWAHGRMANFKLPHRLVVTTADGLPLNATGKVTKPRIVTQFFS